MKWFDKFATAAKKGTKFVPICETHGPHHENTTCEVSPLSAGPLLIFDADRYRDTPGYCVGDDEVSRSLALYGMWEPRVTRLFIDAVAENPGIVIDFGCHVGWYSRLGRLLERDVLAIDAVDEHLEMCAENAPGVRTVRLWVDEHAPAFSATGAPDVAIVKMDIEGSERHALRMIDPLIDAGKVATILMEVSPVFNDSYPATIRSLLARGYTADVVDPFVSLLDENVEQVLAMFGQADVLFRKAT